MDIINQFIITKKNNLKYFNRQIELCKGLFLYAGTSLNVSISENNSIKLIAVGDLYNYKNPHYKNQDIIEEILKGSNDFDSVKNRSFKYSGTYILLYCDKEQNSFIILTDMAAQLEVFYTKNRNQYIVASSAKLINSLFPQKVDTSVLADEFYNSKVFKKKLSYVGVSTNFETIWRLKPNHYLDFNKDYPIRYFPADIIKNQDVSTASKKGAEMIKGYIRSAALRKKLLVPVTAGWDSRLLLAACKEFANDIAFFVILRTNYSENFYDVKVPNKLFKKLNLPFKVVKDFAEISSEDKEKIDSNFYFPNYSQLKHATGFYVKEYPNHILLNGNVSEIARLEFDEVYNLTPKKIAYIQKYPFLKYALEKYEDWFYSNKNLFKKYGFRVLDMLYWEENCANVATKIKSEFNVFEIDMYSPFNSRELILTLMSVDKKYRRKQNPVLYKKMINELWPEVLQVPVNPGPKQIAMRITQKLGIFPIFRNLKLMYYLFLGRNKW